jgi:hypothetical protein
MSCWDVATPHQLLFWSKHDLHGFNIPTSHMLPSPKYIAKFLVQTSPNQRWHMFFLHSLRSPWMNNLERTSETAASNVHKAI